MSNDAGQWQYAAPPPEARPLGAGMAIAALVLGILALVLCWTLIGGVVLGLLAIILGAIASSRAKRGLAAGRGLAIVGITLGVVGLLIAAALIAVGVSFLHSTTFKHYRDCLESANGDKAKVQQCTDDLKHNLQNR